tara:strand:+ start:1353 stop:1502 length:150 start_codon:yes stop_codon:yes gene_type:complete
MLRKIKRAAYAQYKKNILILDILRSFPQWAHEPILDYIEKKEGKTVHLQ